MYAMRCWRGVYVVLGERGVGVVYAAEVVVVTCAKSMKGAKRRDGD